MRTTSSDFPILTPWENMRIDRELFKESEQNPRGGLYRIYGWDRLCVSIGRNQKLRFEIPTVRRPTGGGALLHGWDISFSLIAPRKNWGSSAKDIYLRFSQKLVKYIGEPNLKLLSSSPGYSLKELCYTIPSVGELSVGNRKLFALAMRSGKKVFLIQGTVYESFDYPKAAQILNTDEDILRERITSLREVGIEKEYLLSRLKSFLESSIKPSQVNE
jgi:lipoate-protein ligase A